MRQNLPSFNQPAVPSTLTTDTQIAPEPGYSRRYVYVDQSWDGPRHLAVQLPRIKYKVLVTLGRTQYLPGREVLQLELPLNCAAIEAIDWRMVWDRAYL
jgi:hypothetical protein